MRAFLVAALAFTAVAAAPAPPAYTAPPETARLRPGDNQAAAQAHCLRCHSADYITTQPDRLADPKAFWDGTVTKMQTAYGMKITAENREKVVSYLAQAYP